jgi:hypothetical protein
MSPGGQAGEAAMSTNREQGKAKASSAAAATGALSSRRKETKKAPKGGDVPKQLSGRGQLVTAAIFYHSGVVFAAKKDNFL